MDSKLIKEISDRVRQAQQEKIDATVLAAHLDAIAEVHDADRTTVESIAQRVMNEQTGSKSKIELAQVRNLLWISALVLIMLAVIWLLYDNTRSAQRIEHNGLNKDDLRTLSYLSETLASMNVVKIYITEHYQTMGTFPTSFAEIGVKEGELVTTKYIKRLQLNQDGAIKAQLSNLIGDQYYIVLKPVLRMASHQIEWDCRSNLDLKYLDEIKGCTPDV